MNRLLVLWTLLIVLSPVAVAFAEEPEQIVASRTPLPYFDATLSKGAVQEQGVTIAAKLVEKKTQEKQFGLAVESNLQPYLVSISNDSTNRVLIAAQDATIIAGSDSVPVLSVDKPAKTVFKSFGGVKTALLIFSFGAQKLVGGDKQFDGRQAAINESVVRNFFDKSLKHQILEPGQTAAGLVFFDINELHGRAEAINLPVQVLESFQQLDFKIPIN